MDDFTHVDDTSFPRPYAIGVGFGNVAAMRP